MKKNNYKITVDENSVFEFTPEQIKDFDFVKENDGKFHILKDNKAYRAEIEHVDFAKKQLTIKVNGNRYEIKIEDHFDKLADQLGFSAANIHKASDVKAPMDAKKPETLCTGCSTPIFVNKSLTWARCSIP